MTTPLSPRPLSIKVISCVYLLGSLGELPDVTHTTTAFGFLISGPVALLKNVLFLFLLLSLAIGLWRLRETARRISILYEGYNLLESWILMPLFSSTNGMDFVAKELGRIAGNNPDAQKMMLGLGAVGGFMMSGMSIAILWFLITRKPVFVKPISSTPAS